MAGYARLLADALGRHIAPALAAMGFDGGMRGPWTEGNLQVRAVIDSKANDPYRGGAFTIEFEVSDDERFEEKLAGRVRLDQLLDEHQREAFLRVRNAAARRLDRPPAEHLATIHPSLHSQYLEPFEEATELERGHRFWMRFRDADDLTEWCSLVVSELPTLLERARSLPAHELLLGKPLGW